MKLYTAIGIRNNGDGKSFSVRLGEEEKILEDMEIYIWSSILWTFCEEEKVYGRMEKMVGMALGEERAKQKIRREEYASCLRRLCVRGLVVCSEGEDAEDAVMRLMRSAVMKPSRITFGERFRAFREGMKRGQGLRFAVRAFRKESLDKEERELLWQIHQTGDIARHLKELRENTGRNSFFLQDDAQRDKLQEIMQKDFIASVVTLYGKKLLNICSLHGEAVS